MKHGVNQRVHINNFIVEWFNIICGNFDISNVSWIEDGGMMSDILNTDRTTSMFGFNILIYLEKIKGRIETFIKEWVRRGRKENFVIRSLKG